MKKLLAVALTFINVNVRQRIPELLRQVKDSGANVAFIAKYGAQMIPTCESADLVADQFVLSYWPVAEKG